jgi:hypothetical protein
VEAYLEQLAVTEAVFRSEVVNGLEREAQRLRDHRVIVGDQPATAACLDQLAAALLQAAEVLLGQDGGLPRALAADDRRLVAAR